MNVIFEWELVRTSRTLLVSLSMQMEYCCRNFSFLFSLHFSSTLRYVFVFCSRPKHLGYNADGQHSSKECIIIHILCMPSHHMWAISCKYKHNRAPYSKVCSAHSRHILKLQWSWCIGWLMSATAKTSRASTPAISLMCWYSRRTMLYTWKVCFVYLFLFRRIVGN